MKSSNWQAIREWAAERESMAHQRELSRRHYWTEESEDGHGGDVDRRLTMVQSLVIYTACLVALGVSFYSCRPETAEPTTKPAAVGGTKQFPAVKIGRAHV